MFGRDEKRYRIVSDGSENDPYFVIERKVDLFLWKWWTRNYLSGDEKFFHTKEADFAKKIVNILNGDEEVV